MKGHTAQRGKSWTYWIDVGKDADGKRKQETKGGFLTKRAADEAMREVLVKLARNEHARPSKETLAEFLRRWLPSAKARIRPSTFAMYDSLCEKQVIPALGGVKLQNLTAARLNTFYADLLDHGRRFAGRGQRRAAPRPTTRAGLSATTVRAIHGVMRHALSDAVRWGDLLRNPAEHATPPKKDTPEMRTWTAEQARAFLESISYDRLYAAYALALTTGLRRGELLGLAWRDVDLEAAWLNVRRTVITVNRSVQFSTPKTSAGRRSVALDAGMVELLRQHRLRQLKERHDLGLAAQQPDDLVFASIEGEPLHPEAFSDAFGRLAKAAGLPRIRLHDLRHTAATLLLAAGVHPKVVQERLGHSSVSITLDLYSHTVPSLQEEAASKLGALVLGVTP